MNRIIENTATNYEITLEGTENISRIAINRIFKLCQEKLNFDTPCRVYYYADGCCYRLQFYKKGHQEAMLVLERAMVDMIRKMENFKNLCNICGVVHNE